MKLKTLAIASLIATCVSAPALASSKTNHHFPGIFLGATSVDSETDFSYGFEYEYKPNKMWGAGFVYEKTDDAHHGDGITVKLVSAYVHPWKDLRVGLGFGKETVGGHHSESLTRVSFSYDYHVGEFGIAPTLAFDRVNGETATVFGLAFIKPF
jgi:hypothetical protein